MKTKIFSLIMALFILSSCTNTISSEGVAQSVEQVDVDNITLAANIMTYSSDNTGKSNALELKNSTISDNNDFLNPYDFIIRNLSYKIEYGEPDDVKFSEEHIVEVVSVFCEMGNHDIMTYPIQKGSDVTEISDDVLEFLKTNKVKKLFIEVTDLNIVLFGKGIRLSRWNGYDY